MEINQQLVVDPLIVVHIQLSATEIVDVSNDWNSSGSSGCIRMLLRKYEYGR